MKHRALLALILAAVLGLSGCSGDSAAPVELATVARADVMEIVDAPATVAAKATAVVAAPADGTVASLSVTDGQVVAAGDLLLRIDSPSAQAVLAQAQEADRSAASGRVTLPASDLSGVQAQLDAGADAAFDAARTAATTLPTGGPQEAALAAVEASVARYQAARAQAVASLASLDAGIGSLSSALSSLANAQRLQTRAAVAVAQARVDALEVTAPIAGTVQLGGSQAPAGGGLGAALDGVPSALQGAAESFLGGGGGGGDTPAASTVAVTEGTPVASGQVLATVLDVSALSLTAEVDETDVLLVTAGVAADVEIDALPEAGYTAAVEQVDLTPTGGSGGGVTYRVRLLLGPGTLADGALAPRPRPGMSAVARLIVATSPDAVAVPLSAVVRDGDAESIWVRAQDGTAERRTVTLGAQGETDVAVTEGLETGEQVVVTGADTVREGQDLPA